MKKYITPIFAVLVCVVFFIAYKKNKEATMSMDGINLQTTDSSDRTTVSAFPMFEHENPPDTFVNGKNSYILQVLKTDSAYSFQVSKKNGNVYKVILEELNYRTNNSRLVLKDANKDGYLDIVWIKKWQDQAYLFNPKTENFVEVGEFHDIDTLKINKNSIFYKGIYPLIFLINEEKDFEFMVQTHSELFIIDSTYHKISFATLDNMATTHTYANLNKYKDKKRQICNCYVPPYKGLFSDISIWNTGKKVDNFELKSNQFDSVFIEKYWQKNYKTLLPYGKIFKVRRTYELKYY